MPMEIVCNIVDNLEGIDSTCFALTSHFFFDTIRAAKSKDDLFFGSAAKQLKISMYQGRHVIFRAYWCALMERLEPWFGSKYSWCPHRARYVEKLCQLCERGTKKSQHRIWVPNPNEHWVSSLKFYVPRCECRMWYPMERAGLTSIEEDQQRRIGHGSVSHAVN